MLTVIDEYTPECLAIDVARRLNSQSVLAVLAELMVQRGVPDQIRSDYGPEFEAHAVRDWITKVGAETLFIERGHSRRTATTRASTGSSAMSC